MTTKTKQKDIRYRGVVHYVRLTRSHEELLKALREAESAIVEALGDLTDHFTIKHVRGSLDTVREAIAKAESL